MEYLTLFIWFWRGGFSSHHNSRKPRECTRQQRSEMKLKNIRNPNCWTLISIQIEKKKLLLLYTLHNNNTYTVYSWMHTTNRKKKKRSLRYGFWSFHNSYNRFFFFFLYVRVDPCVGLFIREPLQQHGNSRDIHSLTHLLQLAAIAAAIATHECHKPDLLPRDVQLYNFPPSTYREGEPKFDFCLFYINRQARINCFQFAGVQQQTIRVG